MKKIVLGTIAVIIVLFGIGLITNYNSLVTLDEDIAGKYSQIENRLQERHDKIGQIVDVVNGLQQYALTIYEMVTDARQAYVDAKASGDINDLIEADAAEAEALGRLIAVVEDNNLVTAEVGYQALIVEISAMESALSVARRDYNLAIQDYNTSVRKFPKVLYAGIFGFSKEVDYWKMNDGADEIPVVEFD